MDPFEKYEPWFEPDEKLVDLDKLHNAVNNYRKACDGKASRGIKLERRRQLKKILGSIKKVEIIEKFFKKNKN